MVLIMATNILNMGLWPCKNFKNFSQSGFRNATLVTVLTETNSNGGTLCIRSPLCTRDISSRDQVASCCSFPLRKVITRKTKTFLIPQKIITESNYYRIQMHYAHMIYHSMTR